MRGTVEANYQQTPIDRITPAHAGNRADGSLHRCSGQDHPRACGEQPEGVTGIGYGAGSPPRMRGTALVRLSLALPMRITPAHAGNSIDSMVSGKLVGDHPRACGEQGSPGSHRVPGSGSPPRMRGTALDISDEIRIVRITPAHAGNRGS